MIRIISIASLLALMAACSPSVVDTACTAFGPIQYHGSKDTLDTQERIIRHNAAWNRLCK